MNGTSISRCQNSQHVRPVVFEVTIKGSNKFNLGREGKDFANEKRI